MPKIVFRFLSVSALLLMAFPARGAGPFVSGGGNTIDGRLVEEYALDVRSLPAYIEVVEPMLQRMEAIAGTNHLQPCLFFNSQLLPGALRSATEDKVWYFVQAKLKELPEEVTGISFSSDQIALQSADSVWVDATSFPGLQLQSQGLLIIHELALNLALRQTEGRSLGELDPAQRARIHAEVRHFTAGILNVLRFRNPTKLEDFLRQFRFLPACHN